MAYGWILRFSLPHYSLWNLDTWGYLHPALSIFNGQGFEQTNGRSGFYPSILLSILSIGNSVEGIATAQQVLGFLSGVLLWCVWLQWCRLLPASRLRDIIVPLLGLLVLAIYDWNPTMIVFELSLRPEGVLPFFGFAQLNCVILFCVLIQSRVRRRGLAVVCGSLSIILAYCCFQLKPSWAFATVFTSLPVVVAFLFPWWMPGGGRRVDALMAMVIGFLAITGMSVAYKVWMRPDFASVSFLPTTLFCVHADLISDQLLRNSSQAFNEEVMKVFAENLKNEVAVARTQRGARSLGFDPDYLQYQSSIAMPLTGMNREAIIGLYYRMYLDAWLGNPTGMFIKIWRQMTFFVFPDPKTFLTRQVDFS